MTSRGATRVRAAVLALLVLSLLVPALVAPSAPAGAQQDPAPPPAQDTPAGPVGVELTIVELDAVVEATDPDAALTATLALRAGAEDRRDLRLVTTVHARADGRTGLQAALDGDLGSVFDATSAPLPDLTAGTTRLVTARTETASLSLQGEDRAGVYPVQLQVFDGAEPVGAVVTSLVVLPPEGPAPLPATTVVHLRSDAIPLRDDIAHATAEAAVGPDGPLVAQADQLDAVAADGSAAGVVLAADGRTLEDLTAMADGYVRADGTAVPDDRRVARRAGTVVEAAARLARRGDVETIAYPYAAADLVALVRADLADPALELVAEGGSATSATTGSPVTTGVLVPPDGLDAETLAALGPADAEAVLLDERYLSFADEGDLEPIRRLRTADGGEVRILVPDDVLSQVLADPAAEGVPAVVQRVLAETAAAWLADAGGPRSEALLLSAQTGADLPDGVLAAVTAAVADAPWLRPVGLSELRRRVAPSDRVVRLAYPPRSAASELPQTYVRQYADARAALIPLGAVLPEGDPTTESFSESLEVVPSTAYRDPELRSLGAGRSTDVLQHMAGLTGAVGIVPSAPITLTATTGEVPITVTNGSDVDVDLVVSVEATRFDFADDTQAVTLPARSSQRLVFDARALNPGAFAPVAVTISDPTGALRIARTQISVRSAAVPVVGLVASVGSVLVLLVWGVRQGRRRRKVGRHERRTRQSPAA
ncbi:DUF6049 family protein [Euzebya sp.]|uniref:DUF6049 family protein n=1 Tax=Euzebya sp. TaxID=1971409 RepID=UPI00351513C9